MTFDELKEHVRQLNALLEDPQPGLVSWVQFYQEHMKAISDYWTKN
jgi:hypothetical protein